MSMSLLNSSITQSDDNLYFPLSLIISPSNLDTEVAVHHIEAGQQRRDQVGLVTPHQRGGLVELCQHVALAHQQAEVVREFFLKKILSVTSLLLLVWNESETRYGSVKSDYSHPAGERSTKDSSLAIIPLSSVDISFKSNSPDLHERQPEPGPGPAHGGPHGGQVPHTRRDVRGLRIQLLNLLEQVPQLLFRAQQSLVTQ